MQKTLALSAALITLAAPSIALGQASEIPSANPFQPTVINTEDLSQLGLFVDETVAAQMKALDVRAVTVSIVKDGKLEFAKGYGIANIQNQTPVTAEQTLFRVGSTSKLFTWTAVMREYERGHLDLDADVNTYVESFQIPGTYDSPITLRHLMTHTAGFENGMFGFLLKRDPAQVLPLRESMRKYLPARINPPGKYAAYSNYGAALAGLIVENVSGVPFNEYIKQEILDPLGMTMSSFAEPLPHALLENVATGYARESGVLRAQPFEILANFGPSGSLSATATDMAKFMIAHLNGGRFGDAQILQPDTIALMHSRAFAADARLPGMAYGFYEATINGHHLIAHGGDTSLFSSDLVLDEAENLGIFVSYQGADGARARSEFVDAFYNRYYPKPLERITPPGDFAERAARFSGRYQFWSHNESTLEKSFVLLGGWLDVTVTADNALLLTGFRGPQQYVEIGSNLFRQVDGQTTIAFGENEAGEIDDLYLSLMPFNGASRASPALGSLYSRALPGISLLLLLSVWFGWLYRRRKFELMAGGEKTAIRLLLATSGVHLLFFLILTIVVMNSGTNILIDIPLSFRANLILPIIAAVLSIGLVYAAIRMWQSKYWRNGRCIHYTTVTAASLYMVWFYAYWNVLGFQIQ